MNTSLLKKEYMMYQALSDIKSLISRIKEDEVPSISAQLSYSIVMAFFPFLIFLFTLLGFSKLDSADALAMLSTVLPENVYELISRTVVEVVETRKGDLLSISLLVALWSASAGMGAVIRGLNKAYKEPETRGFIKVKLVTLLSVLVLAFVIILTITLLVLGEVIGDYLQGFFGMTNYYRTVIDLIRYLITALSLIFTFVLLYYLTPCRRLTLREVVPGALFSTAGWLIFSLAFSFYINNFANHSRFYGSLGAIFIFMTWLYISSFIIILGGELNAVLAAEKQGVDKDGRVK
jgi:membrane protein